MAGCSVPVMDEGGSRIRRRVSVRKRTRPSLCAAPIAAELKSDDEEEEEGMVAEYRRRKTVGVQPIEETKSPRTWNPNLRDGGRFLPRCRQLTS